MRVIWVFENIREDEQFYNKLDILLLLASVRLWKRNHPVDTCVLYGDKTTLDLLKELNVTYLWDEIIPYVHTRKINREVFWACSKVSVLAEQNEPCIIMDHDTLVFKPIDQFIQDEVLVANLETGKGYYPTNTDKYIKQLTYRKRWYTESLNVSFLYFPDPTLIKEYTSISLKMMEEFTEMNVPNSQYLIFAEQLLLRDILDTNNIPYKSIIANQWDCVGWKWEEETIENGLLKHPEAELTFKHYGPEKSYIRANKTKLGYDGECKMLFNCINIRTLDLSNITNK